jgi:hypothetical protein
MIASAARRSALPPNCESAAGVRHWSGLGALPVRACTHKCGSRWLLSGEEQTLQIRAVSSAVGPTRKWCVRRSSSSRDAGARHLAAFLAVDQASGFTPRPAGQSRSPQAARIARAGVRPPKARGRCRLRRDRSEPPRSNAGVWLAPTASKGTAWDVLKRSRVTFRRRASLLDDRGQRVALMERMIADFDRMAADFDREILSGRGISRGHCRMGFKPQHLKGSSEGADRG